jgi:DNA-binding FadR family transcriptional regulator
MRGWVEPRRGGGGGLVLTLPTVQDLATLTTLYLYLKCARTDQLIEARRSVHYAIVRKLVMCGGDRHALGEFRNATTAAQTDSYTPLPSLGFSHWLANKTGNRCLAFIMEFVLALYEESAGTHGVAPIAEEDALWDAVCSKDKRRATTLLDRYLACIECLRPGETLSLPRAFPRHGPSGSVAYAAQLTRVLIDEIAQHGQRGPRNLGTEADIGSRHHHNQDIVRQAVRVLEDIGAVVARRGGQGGLTSREPDLAVVIDLIPPLLFQRSVAWKEVFETMCFLKPEAARLAALHVCNATANRRVATLSEHLLSTTPMRSNEFITMENTLIDLAENSVLTACDRGLLLYGPVRQPVDPVGVQATAAFVSMRNLVDAVVRGDPGAAEMIASRRLRAA